MDIVNRSNSLPIHEVEMNEVIKAYIKEVKGVDVVIMNGLNYQFNAFSENNKRLYAFTVAQQYFLSK